MIFLPDSDLPELKRRLLVHEAKRWLRFTESGGDNRGQAVEAFQRAVDGRAIGEPWCMAFVQYCIQQVDLMIDEILRQSSSIRSVLAKSEHCMTVWRQSPSRAQHLQPLVGSVMIWQKGHTHAGHTGIVVSKHVEAANPGDGEWLWTIEGNTGPQEVVTREGDGVYLKKRNIGDTGTMRVKGWLDPWAQAA